MGIVDVRGLNLTAAPAEGGLALCAPHLVTSIDFGNHRGTFGAGFGFLSHGLEIRKNLAITLVCFGGLMLPTFLTEFLLTESAFPVHAYEALAGAATTFHNK